MLGASSSSPKGYILATAAGAVGGAVAGGSVWLSLQKPSPRLWT